MTRMASWSGILKLRTRPFSRGGIVQLAATSECVVSEKPAAPQHCAINALSLMGAESVTTASRFFNDVHR
jgi:hypothetical protein